MTNIAIFGAGGLAKEVLAIIRAINDEEEIYKVVSFVVDVECQNERKELHGVTINTYEWLLNNKEDVCCICAIGYPKDRKRIIERLVNDDIDVVSIKHPKAIIEPGTEFGKGCIFQHHSAVSYDCKLGDGIFLSDYVTIGHDVVVGNYVTCFPKAQISGGVKIGEETLIGSMAYISEKRIVGNNAVVAPGSIVFTNVKANTHVLGNPAKRVSI